MCDRITQLQDAVCQQLQNFEDSISLIQNDCNPSEIPGIRKVETDDTKDSIQSKFAKTIVKTAKDIDTMISTLPDLLDNVEDCQNKSIEQLDRELKDASEILNEFVENGEKLLAEIRTIQWDIARQNFIINNLDTPGVTLD